MTALRRDAAVEYYKVSGVEYYKLTEAFLQLHPDKESARRCLTGHPADDLTFMEDTLTAIMAKRNDKTIEKALAIFSRVIDIRALSELQPALKSPAVTPTIVLPHLKTIQTRPV